MSSDPSGPRNWRKIFAITAAVLMLLLLGASLTLIYGGPSIRKWYALRLSAEAEKLFAEKNYPAAQSKALAAYRLCSTNSRVQRTVGTILASFGYPQAIDLFHTLYVNSLANTADKVLYARLLQESGEASKSEIVLRDVLQGSPDNLDAGIMLAKVLLVQGDNAGTEAQLRAVLAKHPENVEAHVLLGRLLALSPDPTKQAEGVDILKKLAAAKDKTSLDALKYLLRISHNNTPQVREWVQALENHPLKDEDAKLLAADWEIRFDPSKTDVVYARLMEAKETDSPEELQELGRWMNQHAQYERVLKLFPLKTALSRRDCFLIWLDAKGGLSEWKGIQTILKTERIPLEESFVWLFRGRASAALNESSDADVYYNKAINAAFREPKILWYLAGYFHEIGNIDFSKKSLTALTQNPVTARAGYKALLVLAAEQRDTTGILSILKEMRRRWPQDKAIENDQRYFMLLTGSGSNQEKDIRKLVESDPASLPFETTLALYFLKNGKSKEALDVYKDLRIEWASVNPGLRVVYCAVLEANGFHGKALEIAMDIPLNSLRMEEKAILVPIIQR
ncbi:MAG: hypothetical protein ABI443_14075 [Chthoniobacterales bacterium]